MRQHLVVGASIFREERIDSDQRFKDGMAVRVIIATRARNHVVLARTARLKEGAPGIWMRRGAL